MLNKFGWHPCHTNPFPRYFPAKPANAPEAKHHLDRSKQYIRLDKEILLFQNSLQSQDFVHCKRFLFAHLFPHTPPKSAPCCPLSSHRIQQAQNPAQSAQESNLTARGDIFRRCRLPWQWKSSFAPIVPLMRRTISQTPPAQTRGDPAAAE